MKSLLVSCAVLVLSGCGSSTEPNAVAAVAVTPDSVTLTVESIKQFAAVPSNADGSVLSGRLITWSTSDKTIATVSRDGLVKGIAPGTAVIRAVAEGKTGEAEINVLPMIGSLTGVWNAASAGSLTSLQLRITEANSESVTGQWSGYAASCTPANSAQCQRSGTVSSGYRHGSSVQLVLRPNSSCDVGDGTITGMFASSNQITGAFNQHLCNSADQVPAIMTLERQQ